MRRQGRLGRRLGSWRRRGGWFGRRLRLQRLATGQLAHAGGQQALEPLLDCALLVGRDHRESEALGN